MSDDQHPCLKELCEALGWQGGTIHQVIAEIVRLRQLTAEPMAQTPGPLLLSFYSASQVSERDAQWAARIAALTQEHERTVLMLVEQRDAARALLRRAERALKEWELDHGLIGHIRVFLSTPTGKERP